MARQKKRNPAELADKSAPPSTMSGVGTHSRGIVPITRSTFAAVERGRQSSVVHAPRQFVSLSSWMIVFFEPEALEP